MAAPVVVLAGGTGGAKLARGLLDEAEELVVIANTGDDVEIHGGHVSPDPDLVTFWLADRIDERGWGLRGDTFHVMEGLRCVDAGPLEMARLVEPLTALLIGINGRYRTHAGIRITGLPDGDLFPPLKPKS